MIHHELLLVLFYQGLKHLHDNDMVHMDIKPANIFIGLDGLCKIGDFGLVLELSKVSNLLHFSCLSFSECSQNYSLLSRQKVTGCVFDTGWNVIVVIMFFVLCNTNWTACNRHLWLSVDRYRSTLNQYSINNSSTL